jgi:phosphomannomutase
MTNHPNSTEPQDRPNPNQKLVKVFDSERESEALVVSGLLESAGIDSDVTSIDAAQNIYPGVGGSIVLVREDQAEEARRIIAESKELEETAEIDLGVPPAGTN